MSIIKNQFEYPHLLELDKLDVFEPNGNNYFSVSGLPSILGYGKHSFYLSYNDIPNNPFQLKDGSGNQVFLDKRDTSFMAEYYNTPGTASGLPKYYGNWDANFWVVAPTPNSTFEITLAYTKQPISITNTTQPTAAPAATAGTFVSNKYQDLLLYACLVEAYGYLKGPVDMLQYYEQSYQRAAKSYSIETEGRRRRDEWQDGAIRAQIKSPSP